MGARARGSVEFGAESKVMGQQVGWNSTRRYVRKRAGAKAHVQMQSSSQAGPRCDSGNISLVQRIHEGVVTHQVQHQRLQL